MVECRFLANVAIDIRADIRCAEKVFRNFLQQQVNCCAITNHITIDAERNSVLMTVNIVFHIGEEGFPVSTTH